MAVYGDRANGSATPTAMDEGELKSILANEIHLALGADGGKLSTDRRELLEAYEGLPYGNEIDGRSQVVSRNVMEAVEWSLPALLRIFLASDKICEFEPYRPGEEAMAAQATDYVNFILQKDNHGFMLFHDWFKTCLIQKNSYLKVYYSEQRTFSISTYSGLSDLEYQQITAGDDIEVIEETTYPNPDPMLQWFTEDSPQPGYSLNGGSPNGEAEPSTQPSAQSAYGAPEAQPSAQSAYGAPPAQPQLHDVKLRVWQTEGRIKIDHVLPEEILVSRRAPTTALDGKHFVCHRALQRVTDLREMGFAEDLIQQVMGFDQQEFNSERVARFQTEDDWPMTGDRTDPAMREVWIEESWINIDYDGDGIAEL